MKKTLTVLAALTGAALLSAQSLSLPQGLGAIEGNSSNAYPWGRGNNDLRLQTCYDSSHFTGQSIVGPVVIHRLKWRANSSTTAYAGGTYNNVTIDLATSANDWSALSSVFSANRGGDFANGFTGTVTVQPTVSVPTGTPNSYHVDVVLTQPFVYDPGNGDLLIEVAFAAGNASGVFPQGDVHTTSVLSSRVFSTLAASTTGTFGTNHGVVMEIGYTPVSNAALRTRFGTGCYDLPGTFYEDFASPAATSFDLQGSAATPTVVDMIFTGNAYVVMPGQSAWFPPNTAAPRLLSNATVPAAINDDEFSGAVTLPFAFPHPGGSTSVVHAASNGYLHLGPTTSNASDFSATPEELIGLHPRLAIAWYDWHTSRNVTTHPDAGIYFDVDPSGQTVYFTWCNVGENGTSAPGTCVANFQIALHQNGRVEFRYAGTQPLLNTVSTWRRMVVGWSKGGNVSLPASIDLSTALPITTGDDLTPPALDASARPVMGTTVNLNTTNCGNASVGLLLLSFVPGTSADLGAFGMPGCNAYVDLASAIQIGFPIAGGVGSVPVTVPNSPSLNGFVGYLQSGILVPGYNVLGALATNGLQVTLGLN